MTNYRIDLGEPYQFTASNDAEFLGSLRSKHMYAKTDDYQFLRQHAASAVEWTGKHMNFSDVPSYKQSLIKAGALEVIDA